jgi:hypothetical protein
VKHIKGVNVLPQKSRFIMMKRIREITNTYGIDKIYHSILRDNNIPRMPKAKANGWARERPAIGNS